MELNCKEYSNYVYEYSGTSINGVSISGGVGNNVCHFPYKSTSISGEWESL